MDAIFEGDKEDSKDEDDHVAVKGKHKNDGNKRKVLDLENRLKIRGGLQKSTNPLKE